jgi:hypothetical protein
VLLPLPLLLLLPPLLLPLPEEGKSDEVLLPVFDDDSDEDVSTPIEQAATVVAQQNVTAEVNRAQIHLVFFFMVFPPPN